jgi:hypothetical protein
LTRSRKTIAGSKKTDLSKSAVYEKNRLKSAVFEKND